MFSKISSVVVASSAVAADAGSFRVLSKPTTTLSASSAGSVCPARLTEESEYVYNEDDWGALPGTYKNDPNNATNTIWGQALEKSAQSIACVWVSVCKSNATNKDECLERCPVAVAIGGMESQFNPSSYAVDNGYGLWQIGGPGAPANLIADFQNCPTKQNIDPTTHEASPKGSNKCDKDGTCTCAAYNPLTLGKWVVRVTEDGKSFNPPGRCWSTCNSGAKACNPGAQSNWTSGWTASWANHPQGGAQGYAKSDVVRNACKAAIEEQFDGKTVSWDSPDSCSIN